ncbi:tetratricopeptide repeat protein [Lentzea jiangxiensis]|uniref:Tetratricopeptide repeat-containing protein n=1 Tax=Lentzea jiangxiensis TaxID=641025 RepID=A0A1H0SIQ7_9PSEU|nr:tetratricopeptide repeat protein [Lentzea jiangxiensis]SDP41702.1 Tetratricopeptide repeat-containing protein [Lentzea jiangxiensis]
MNIAHAKMRSGRYREAISVIKSISGFEDADTPVSQIAFQLDVLSDAHERLGEYDESVAVHEREITVLREQEIFGGAHAAFLDETISLSMFTLARSLFLAGRHDRAASVQRDAFLRLRSFLAAPKSGSDFWALESGRLDQLLCSIDVLLADGLPDATWFMEGIRVFDAVTTAARSLDHT